LELIQREGEPLGRDNLAELIGLGEPQILDDHGGQITEGPLWHPEGYLTYVRLRESELVRWDAEDGVQVVRRNTGGGNGCTFDAEGRLVMCHFGDRTVTRTEKDGTVTVIAESYRGTQLNQPNDIVRHQSGDLYFTDPYWSLPPEDRHLGYNGVFRLHPDGSLDLATDECEFPNGLAFSPDESVLYVAITRRDQDCLKEVENGGRCPHRYLRAFDVAADGSLSNNRVFFDMSDSDGEGWPDGLKVDVEGRIYCTGPGGVWVISPEGTGLGLIGLGEIARNLSFGGPDMSTMYVTAGGSLYSLSTTTRGIPAYPV
jgi:gluconolactonase